MRQRAKAQEVEATQTQTQPTREVPLVGNLIGEDHVNYVLMYNMLTGIRIGVCLRF
jgi:1-phosphatidylinositol-4-phosphate 5-kinase